MTATCSPAGPPIVCILPPHLLRHLSRQSGRGLKRLADWAHQTLVLTERLRGQRLALGVMPSLASTPAGRKRRTIYDAGGRETLPATLVRGEGDPPGRDVMVNEAYDGAGQTYDFYLRAYARNSIDGRGMRLDSSVHYGHKYDNAFWNGTQMVYGDGDGALFERFTKCVDVIGHELTHGVTQYEAGLVYEGQSGALNESLSDVFGSLVKQYGLKQTAAKADWLIGAGLFTPSVKGVALRSMKAPGTAYDDPRLGADPQPADMAHYVDTSDDSGGVHLNSGIPNRAFYLAALALGGHAWTGAGRVWYVTLRDRLQPHAQFSDAARATIAVAGELLGKAAAQSVTDAWTTVGVSTRAALRSARLASRVPKRGRRAHRDRPQRRTARRRPSRRG